MEWASQSCESAPCNAFGEIRYMWDSAAYVPLSSGYIFHLGGFNMTVHAYDTQIVHRVGGAAGDPDQAAAGGAAQAVRCA